MHSHACTYPAGGGGRLIKDVRDGRGVKGKADKCGKGGEGVQNPGNFADVLYVWSLMVMKIRRNSSQLSPSVGLLARSQEDLENVKAVHLSGLGRYAYDVCQTFRPSLLFHIT